MFFKKELAVYYFLMLGSLTLPELLQVLPQVLKLLISPSLRDCSHSDYHFWTSSVLLVFFWVPHPWSRPLVWSGIRSARAGIWVNCRFLLPWLVGWSLKFWTFSFHFMRLARRVRSHGHGLFVAVLLSVEWLLDLTTWANQSPAVLLLNFLCRFCTSDRLWNSFQA